MASKRARKSPGGKPPGRTRKTISLDADLARRLATFAAWHGRNEQDVVAEALEPLLRGFYAGQRGISDPPPLIEPIGPRLAASS
jgi:hypothetical protein